MSTPVSRINQHASCPTHCCPKHGCKYGYEDCPVKTKIVVPVYPHNNGCEICEDDLNENEILQDGLSIEPFDYWTYRHQRWQVERLLWQNDVLYALMKDRDWDGVSAAPDLALIPAASLLREGRKEGVVYPETLRCNQCGVEATGTEVQLENAGWWIYGMGSGPRCPEHNT